MCVSFSNLKGCVQTEAAAPSNGCIPTAYHSAFLPGPEATDPCCVCTLLEQTAAPGGSTSPYPSHVESGSLNSMKSFRRMQSLN